MATASGHRFHRSVNSTSSLSGASEPSPTFASSTSSLTSYSRTAAARYGSDTSLVSTSDASPIPHGTPYLDWVKVWGDDEVGSWLAENNCSNYAQAFKDHDIRGDVLLDVDQQALKELGVHSVGDRIKIVVAIKKLRTNCLAALHRPVAPSHVIQASTNGTSSAVNSRPGSRSGNRTVPPPLHLHQSSSHSRLGQAVQAPVTNVPNVVPQTASRLQTNATSSLLAAPASGSSSSLLTSPTSAQHRRGSSPRQAGPPLHPAPKGSLPLPPPEKTPQASSRPSTRERSPGSSTRPTEYALPRAPNPGNVGSQSRSNASKPSQNWPQPTNVSLAMAGQAAQSHRRTNSAERSGLTGSRPATTAGTYGHHQPLSSHPYATAASASPTGDHFGSSSLYPSSTSAPSTRPGTAPSKTSMAYATSPGAGLSPITEQNSSATSPIAPEGPKTGLHPASASSSSSGAVGFTVGRGGFSRPSTPAGTVSVGASGLIGAAAVAPPLEDLLRRTVKFIGPDDGASKMVNVENVKDASEVLVRVLKKFGKLPVNQTIRPPSRTGEDVERITEIEGWAIFATTSDGQGGA